MILSFLTISDFHHWLVSPVFDRVLLTKGLVLFSLFLIVIRCGPRTIRNLAILAVSLGLIAIMTSPLYTGLFLVVTFFIHRLCLWIPRSSRRRILSYGVSAMLVILFFLLMDLEALQSPWTGQLVHKFGIAYSLFRLLAVVLDAGQGKSLPTNPLEFFVFAFFAPTFFQGPIERFGEFQENLREDKRSTLTWKRTGWNLARIAGAFLKGWVAVRFFEIDWKAYFDYPQNLSYGFLWWGMYARAISFYIIVSAANDLTIACCAIAGFHIHENYNYPYFKRNLAEFWRSWHMTLFRFLKDYLYIPMGGNRRHVYVNVLVIFMAVAMWHVTSMAFVIWGLWHGIGMCLLRLWQQYWKKIETTSSGLARHLQVRGRKYPRVVQVASVVFTFHFVAIGWLPFWGGHPQGLSMILRLISGNHWKLFVWT